MWVVVVEDNGIGEEAGRGVIEYGGMNPAPSCSLSSVARQLFKLEDSLCLLGGWLSDRIPSIAVVCFQLPVEKVDWFNQDPLPMLVLGNKFVNRISSLPVI